MTSRFLTLCCASSVLWACGTVQQDDRPPAVAPITRNAHVPEDPESAGAPFTHDPQRAVAARQAIGLAGLDLGKGVLLACPGVKPPSFDYEVANMEASLDETLLELGRCASVGRLAQSRLRLLVWEGAAGEALRALLIAQGVPEARIEVVPQGVSGHPESASPIAAAPASERAKLSAGGEPQATSELEWSRVPRVRVELVR